ncbi:MAG: LLM class flavin-dependent oxidoreductase, partial [Thermomicrobiales bacterium]
DRGSLELIVALTYLADHTERVYFGSMVSPVSIRDPVLLARQAAALNDLSGGRMVLGLGAGWAEREHQMFGYQLGSVETRMERFEEGLKVVTGLHSSSQPLDFGGDFFRLQEAMLVGPGMDRHVPIMIGGSGIRRTLPLVARFADIWSAQGVTVEQMHERMVILDRLLIAEGRTPGEVRRLLNVPIICARSKAELEDRVKHLQVFGVEMPVSAVLQIMQEAFGLIVGTPDEVVAQIQAYVAIGVSEISVQWFGVEDVAGLEILAQEVLSLTG